MNDELDPYGNDKSSIDRLREQMYTKQGPPELRRRKAFVDQKHQVNEQWQDEAPAAKQKEPGQSLPAKILSKFFWFSILFFVVAMGVAAVVFIWGINILPGQDVELSVTGPASANSGEEVSLHVAIANRSNLPLESAELVLLYPDGTYSIEDVTASLGRVRKPLDDVGAGATVQATSNAIFFGDDGDEKEVMIELIYRVQGVDVPLRKEAVYTVFMRSSPLVLSVGDLRETSAGQEFELSITVRSNTNTRMENVVLMVEYPFGYTFIRSDEEPVQGNNMWRVGSLAPGESKTVNVRGLLQGQDGQERAFRLYAGLRHAEEPERLSAIFGARTEVIRISRPFLGVQLGVNGQTGTEHVVDMGSSVNSTIHWTNNLDTRLTDTQISVRLIGDMFDRSSVRVSRGFWRSATNTVFWDQSTMPDLMQLLPGGRGSASFSFEFRNPVTPTGVHRNPVADLEISVAGRRISEAGVPETITNTAYARVKLNSTITNTPRAFYYDGPFANTGPLPPRADRETTYTIVWRLSNTSSDVENVVVRAPLPPHARWVGVVSPADEDIDYARLAGQIVWRPGSISAGAGIATAPREVAFQIVLEPSVSQIGSALPLVPPGFITADDTFTGQELSAGFPAVTTDIAHDSQAPDNVDRVQP